LDLKDGQDEIENPVYLETNPENRVQKIRVQPKIYEVFKTS